MSLAMRCDPLGQAPDPERAPTAAPAAPLKSRPETSLCALLYSWGRRAPRYGPQAGCPPGYMRMQNCPMVWPRIAKLDTTVDCKTTPATVQTLAPSRSLISNTTTGKNPQEAVHEEESIFSNTQASAKGGVVAGLCLVARGRTYNNQADPLRAVAPIPMSTRPSLHPREWGEPLLPEHAARQRQPPWLYWVTGSL